MCRLLVVLVVMVSSLSSQSSDSLFYGNSKKLPKNPYGWGYISGRNGYGDLGKYQRFDVKQSMTVVGTKIWMALTRVANTPDSITIVFKKTAVGKQNYDSLSGGPGETIASIQTITTDFDTSGKPTMFMLPKSFTVAGSASVPESIFVGIEWASTANDTFALFADSASQGGKANRAWEKVSDVNFQYQRLNEPNDYSWLLDADLWIALLYKRELSIARDEHRAIPQHFALEQNYPNPFNPATTIRFSITKGTSALLTVYDMLGKEVAVLVNEYLEPGTYTSTFTAKSLSSGLYFYRLRAGDVVETKKMTLVK
jgi:hypothetical protein